MMRWFDRRAPRQVRLTVGDTLHLHDGEDNEVVVEISCTSPNIDLMIDHVITVCRNANMDVLHAQDALSPGDNPLRQVLRRRIKAALGDRFSLTIYGVT